jgi:hypothetical protein
MPEMACPVQMEVCIYEPAFMLDMASPSGGNYSGTGIEDGIFYPEVAGAGTHNILYQFANEFACEGECSFDIIVHPIPVIGCEDIGQVCKYDEPIDLLMCTPGGGSYESPYVINNTFFPEIAGEGMHEINYHYINPLTSCETDVTFNIDVLPSQVVNLNSGWAGISSFLIPRSEDIPNMFSNIENQLTILYNLDGNVYYPDGNLIPTQPWNMYSGYCIKMKQPVLMNFCRMYRLWLRPCEGYFQKCYRNLLLLAYLLEFRWFQDQSRLLSHRYLLRQRLSARKELCNQEKLR